ncbi:MAG: iron-sulfur cluster assembly accessory protein [Dehalococcoidia bacterium]
MNLIVTDIAQTRLTDLLGDRVATEEQGIRIFAQSGGGCACSGPRFGMGLDALGEQDSVFKVGELTFIVDPDSAPVLEDASIDYVEDVMQQGFSITAPNAAAAGGGACGCGGGHGH